jgi:hypothetical protein
MELVAASRVLWLLNAHTCEKSRIEAKETMELYFLVYV